MKSDSPQAIVDRHCHLLASRVLANAVHSPMARTAMNGRASDDETTTVCVAVPLGILRELNQWKEHI